MPLITVDDSDRPEARWPAQDSPSAVYARRLDQPAAVLDPARSVALWLRGRSFALGTHPDALLGDANDLLRHLWRAGYVLEYVGDERR